MCTLIPCNQVEVSLINHGRSPFPCYSVQGNKTFSTKIDITNLSQKDLQDFVPDMGGEGSIYVDPSNCIHIKQLALTDVPIQKNKSLNSLRMHLARNSCTYGLSKSKSYFEADVEQTVNPLPSITVI